ncbi:ATP-binding cassette sub-family G member 4 [Halotydeus destructor]|nr:ATP-binding cassette sub-family G member 4 [Halotydeus destructor]
MYLEIVAGLLSILLWSVYRKLTLWSRYGVPYDHMHFIKSFQGIPAFIDKSTLEKSGKVIGVYAFLEPMLLIGDLNIARKVLSTQFEDFVNHSRFQQVDAPMGDSLFTTNDDRWREMKRIISPSFTPAKVRSMQSLIDDSCSDLIKQFELNENMSMDIKNSICGFALDVIASTAFGTKVNTAKNPENEIAVSARRCISPEVYLKALSMVLFPWLSLDVFKMSIFTDTAQFFADFTMNIIHQRRKDISLQRNDLIKMEKAQSKKFVDDDLDVLSQDVAQLPVAEIYKSGSKDHPFRSHVWYNFQREMVLSFRDPLIFVLRFVSSIIMAIFMSLIFGTVGRAGGCPPEIDGDFEPTDLDGAAQHIEHQLEQVFNNIGLTFFSVLFMIFNSLMPVAMTFPDQLKVFIKEKNNGWHKLRAFFFGKLLAELPFNIILPPLFSAVLWYMSEQVPETWRYLQYVGLMIVITFIGSSAGLAISAAYMNDMAAAIYLAPLSIIPIMTFSGMFVKLSSMPSYMRVITYASYLRWAFEVSW